jgi:hypothetical protein
MSFRGGFAPPVTPRALRRDDSDRGFAIGLYLEHFEEASFLYDQRCVILNDAAIDWQSLADVEERLEAHLDALTLGGELALAVAQQQALAGDGGEYHAAISVACRNRSRDGLRSMLDVLDPADEDRIRAAGDAMCRDLPTEWNDIVSRVAAVRNSGAARAAARVVASRQLRPVQGLVQAQLASPPGARHSLPLTDSVRDRHAR